MSALADGDDIPFPLLEKGDFVRLKEPYKPVMMGPAIERSAADLARERINPGADYFPWENVEDAPVPWLKDQSHTEHLFEFTHGTVVQVVSRYPRHQVSTTDAEIVHFEDTGGGPPRNVSLHLFNPDTGLMYVGSHPSEPGKPEFVDNHVGGLVLVHKHNETWGNEYDIDIAEVYAGWGIEDLGISPEEDG